jgi:signal recognition particle receptor subunit beta
LFTILTEPAISSVPILIVCNKQDQALAKGSAVIKSLLTKELNLVRTTRASELASTDNSSKSSDYLGKRGEDFQFEHLPQNVEFLECSALKGDVEELTVWIEKYA